jgi:hypothetical protein
MTTWCISVPKLLVFDFVWFPFPVTNSAEVVTCSVLGAVLSSKSKMALGLIDSTLRANKDKGSRPRT